MALRELQELWELREPSDRVYSTGEFAGLKLAIFDHFCDVLVTYKDIPTLFIGLFSLQIWPDIWGSKIGMKKAEIHQ